MRRQFQTFSNRSAQAGLTLIEFMVAILLGMVIVAAMAVLIGNQSAARGEIDRAGRLIENGRYSITTMVEDLQMAGYWGEIYINPDAPTGMFAADFTSLPNPCSVTVNSPEDAASKGLKEGTFLYIQGYDGSTYTAGDLSCVTNWKAGTDILVVRRADPNAVALASLVNGQMYLQTGLTSATGTTFAYSLAPGASADNATTFNLVTQGGVLAQIRPLIVHIYYVATCDVCTGGSADTIPTLKRVDLGVASGVPQISTVAIAEGIENLQIDYGYDADGDGAPDADYNAANTGFATPDTWKNVMSAKIYLLARDIDKSIGFVDGKAYSMGTASVAAPNDAYKRHLFMQSVRIANPSLRRSS
ncbi:hypothetical protein EEB15_14785 [Ramlibacter sp. WS9]|nr:hypothetical protein EEB15_14785 [Ramlibacter sp. WS9]